MGQSRALRAYAIDRATRLWTVLVPTLFLVIGIGLVTGAAMPAPAGFGAPGEFSAGAFVGNLLGLQTIVVDRFGGNYPLRSLANKTWYYIQLLLLLLVFTGRGLFQQAAGAAMPALTFAFLPCVMSLHFAIWLLGALFSRIRIDSPAGARMLLPVAVGVSVYYRINGANDDIVPESFVQDLVCSLPILPCWRPCTNRSETRPSCAAWAYSANGWPGFRSRYVLHVPVIHLLQHAGRAWFGREKLDPSSATDLAVYFAILGILMCGSYLFYLFFERNTYRVRRFVKRVLLPSDPKRAADHLLGALSQPPRLSGTCHAGACREPGLRLVWKLDGRPALASALAVRRWRAPAGRARW